MIVENPLDQELSINYKGDHYTVGPRGSIGNVPKEVAIHWKDRIHSFITITDDVGTEENPMTRAQAVEVMGEEAVEKIEAESIESPELPVQKAPAKKGKK